MPRLKLTKSAIDALSIPSKDIVYWDVNCPGFGVKVTPTGRKVFVVLYRTAGAASRLRKYTIGTYGRVTLNQARVAAQKVFAAKLDGRDLAAERKESRRRMVADRVDHLLEAFIAQHVSQNSSGPEISRMLRREIGSAWANRSIHEITKRDVIDIDRLPTAYRLPRDRVLNDDELARIIVAARQIGGSYGGIVEMLALTGQRREEVAQCTWSEIEIGSRTWKLSSARTKNAKAHEVYLSDQAIAVLGGVDKTDDFVFSRSGNAPFQDFTLAKRELDQLSSVTGWRLHDLRRTCVSGMARLGIAPHVADKVLNHKNGTISGVAAVYQRHDFLQNANRRSNYGVRTSRESQHAP